MDRRIKNEIEHGKYLAESGAGQIWNWETPAGKLRWARRARMLTEHLHPGMTVLELGCGTGYFSRELAKTGAEITAIDISLDLLSIAKAEITTDNVIFCCENAYEMGFADNSYDAVVGSSVLHHLDIDKAVRECFRVLKPNGTIRFTEPNMMNPQNAVQFNIRCVGKRLGVSPDEKAFFRWRIYNKLTEAGFVDISIQPFDFLHPQIPQALIPYFQPVCPVLEKVPLVKEIAGSLYIIARKPGNG